MIRIVFSQEDIRALNFERYHHPHPRVQRKMEVLWLKSQNIAHKQISKLAGVSVNIVTNYLEEYVSGGIEKLKEIKFYQPQSELKQHTKTIEEYFRQHPPATIKEAVSKIQELTGIKRSDNKVRKFLKSIGLVFRKVGTVPAKADLKKQESFKIELLEPRLSEAKAGKRAVFFIDAAHFVLAPFLGYLWSFTRIFIKAPCGRKRFNILGALNAITHELIMVTNDTYINAQSVCELLWKIAGLNLNIPITLILDNARYQKCAIIFNLAQSLNIELLYLPSYSPNLNLIERLWKFVKKKCLYSKYYSEFATFKKAITDCLEKTHSTYKEDCDSLLTLNFQTFSESQIASY